MAREVARQCEAEGCERPAQARKTICATCLGNHAPVPDHHVAAVRSCLRCGEGFESSWSGDRRCPACRERERLAEKDAAKRGHTPAHYVSPLEPLHVPGIGGE